MKVMEFFKVMLIVQLFYSFAITSLAYALPDDSLDYVTGFSDITSRIDLESVSEDVQESLEKQTNIPVIELGALIFYSGNILIDLLLNFAFAIPEMIGMLIHGITMLLLGTDSYLFATVQLFSTVAITITYIIAIIQLISSVRSGRQIT